MTFNDTDLTRDRTMDSCDKHEPPPSTTLVRADDEPLAVTFILPLNEKYHCTFTQNDQNAHHLKPPVKQLACGHRLVALEKAITKWIEFVV